MADELRLHCRACEHRWAISREEYLKLRRMLPPCPECGSMFVREQKPPPK